MIDEKIIAIISFCNSEEKIEALSNNIKLIREKYKDFKIALHANYPLDINIQRQVDHYFYEDLNFSLDEFKIISWNIYRQFNRKFILTSIDYGFSVFQQIRNISKYLYDYNKILLMNYDTILKDIYIDDYNNIDSDIITYKWDQNNPDSKSINLVLMSFKPSIFNSKISNNLTKEKYFSFRNMMAEEKFYSLVFDSKINHFSSNEYVFDTINGNYSIYISPKNNYFKHNLICYANNILEIYLWELFQPIYQIKIEIDNQIFSLNNFNFKGDFESELRLDKEEINKIKIISINDNHVSISLRILKNVITEKIPISFNFNYDINDNRIDISVNNIIIDAIINIFNKNKELLYSSISTFYYNTLWFKPSINLYDINNIIIQILDSSGSIIEEKSMTLK